MDKAKILPVLKWLIRSFEVTRFKGSSHDYSHWLNGGNGWSHAYPETTGYIIETLLKYDTLFEELKLKDLAVQQCYWLLDQQLPSGAFPAGKLNSSKPSIFNSGQIIFGLMDGWRITQDERFRISITSVVEWLLSQLDDDNKWSNYAWTKGHHPSYYSRVIWPILEAAELLKRSDWLQWIYPSFEYYANQQNENYSFKRWGFHPNQPAFTHTIAYTLRGLLESASLLNEKDHLLNVEHSAQKFLNIYKRRGHIAGLYDENWKGDYSFICITGNAQLSIFFFRLYEITKKDNYREMSIKLFKDISSMPKRSLCQSMNGAIAGSSPIYGKYNPFRYPNWATKFYLDAWWLQNG